MLLTCVAYVTTCGWRVSQLVGGVCYNLCVGCVEGKSHNLWVGCVTTCGWGALQLVDEECAYAVCSSPQWQLSKKPGRRRGVGI